MIVYATLVRRRVQVLNERRPVGTEASLLDCSSDDNGLSLCGSDRGNATDATALACGTSAPGAHAPGTATRLTPQQRVALFSYNCFCKLAPGNELFPMRSGPSVHWQHWTVVANDPHPSAESTPVLCLRASSSRTNPI